MRDEPTSTVVSILPLEIRDSKPNLYPGNFIIPAGMINKPGLLEVTKSVFYIPMAFGAPSLQAASSCLEVAESIVRDYVDALIGISDDNRPGIWVENQTFKDSQEAAIVLMPEIQKRIVAQRNWFVSLVNLADAEFRQHNQANSISSLQKLAARELNLKDRPWMITLDQLSVNNCPMCFSQVNAAAVMCGACRYVIKPELYDPKKFAVTTGA
jgi:hypothetical protein